MLSPTTSDLLSTYDCELMSPCISVVSAGERGVVARPATIKDGEGIWIRLELTHSMQSLLDSCGNGRLSWLYVAVRLDVANALSVNPRHLKLISLEERPGNKVILQLILMQPPDSTLSLAKVGEVLHEQALAQASLAQARCLEPQSGVDATPKSSPTKCLKGPPAVSLTASPSLQSLAQTVFDESEGESTCFGRVPSAVEMPSPAKRLLISTGACGQSMAQRASGVVLKNRKRVVNLLQLVEKVEVKLAPPAKLASGSLRNGVYTALVLLVLTSFTYLASAFGVLPASMPLRSSSSHASSAATLTPNARVGAFAPAPFLLARAPRAVVRTSGGMTQLRMLEPMTLATMALMGASKLTGTVTKIKEAKGNSPPPAAASSADEDRPLLQLINMAQDAPASGASRGQRKAQRRSEKHDGNVHGPQSLPVTIVSASTQTLDRLSTSTLVAAKSAACLAHRRAKVDKRRLSRTVKTIKDEPDDALTKASEYMTDKLDDELSVESMVVEDTMESVLDVLDKVGSKLAQHTTTLMHHSTHVGHSATNMLGKHVVNHADSLHSASQMLHKAQFVDVFSSAVHMTSMFSFGGITSVGMAVGMAYAMAVFDDVMGQDGNIEV